MTVDIRAKVICDLGEVISGGWSDDHVQGTGLIRTRGEIILKGLLQPTLGQKVQLAYVQNGYASRFPRSLRVLGAFADPFRRQTTIQLGCLLTLRENLRPQSDAEKTADTWNDPNNDNIVCNAFAEGATISISASYVAALCAERLGLAHTGFEFLTNWFTVEQFDLTPGYGQVLGDLLVSESYVGFLDASETLQIRSLLDFTGTYTVIAQDRVIDIGSINSGDIPGDAVTTSYSYNRYVVPETLDAEAQLIRDWEKDETVGPSEVREISHTRGTYSRVVTPQTTVVTTYDTFDRVLRRVETTKTHVCVTNPAYVKWFSGQGTAFNDVDDYIIKQTVFNYETPANELAPPPDPGPGQCAILYGNLRFFDPERDSKILSEVSTTYQSEMAVAGALNIPEYSGTYTTPAGGSSSWEYQPLLPADVVVEIVETTYEQDVESGITKTIVTTQQAQAFTQSGQQVGALEVEDGLEFGNVTGAVLRGMNLVNLGSVVTTRTDREYGVQRRPSRSERNNNATRKSFTETESTIVFVYGETNSENITNYQLPYSPDDRIGYNVLTGLYELVSASDAEVKARNFGRAQNGLAFGHRNGFSTQLAAPEIPPYPLDRLRIDAGDYGSGYICNGTSWSFDSNGIVCNTDALFVGGIGSTALGGSLWFPVQPGISLLGPAPEIYENEYPEPANSLPVDESFNPLDPPPTFWDEDLPEDSPAVPAAESEIPQLVPAWREEIDEVLVSRAAIRVTRGIVNIPTVQPVALTVRTAITAFDLSARIVSIPVKTRLIASESVPAIREAAVEHFTLFTLGVLV
jgi:hypothetical protein